MAYEHLRPRPTTPDQPAASPQPNGESMVELFQRTGKLPLDARAGDGFSDAERQRAREIRYAQSEGRWCPGTEIPHRLMPLVYEGGMPQTFQPSRQAVDASSIAAAFDTKGGGNPVSRIARQINASLITDRDPTRRLATDQAPRPRNDLATDGPQHRPTMSYELGRVLGDWDYMSEDDFDASMKNLDITDTTRRIALKQEALACGVMRARGTRNTRSWPPRQYRPMPGMDDPNTQHFVHKDSKEATKSTAGNPRTIQACTEEGYAAYDRTSIDL